MLAALEVGISPGDTPWFTAPNFDYRVPGGAEAFQLLRGSVLTFTLFGYDPDGDDFLCRITSVPMIGTLAYAGSPPPPLGAAITAGTVGDRLTWLFQPTH